MSGSPFNGCSKVILNCGNIATWSKIRNKVLLTTVQELSSSLENTLISSNGSASMPNTDDNGTCYIRNSGLYQVINPVERSTLNLTLKLFLTEWDGHQVSEAIFKSLDELGVESVDTAIISFPPCSNEEFILDRFKSVWLAMESAARDGRIKYLGTSDLNMNSLKLLYEWATIKPQINQMNLAHCCTIPEDLAEYCKDVNVRLLTHNDERDILPVDQLSTILSTTSSVAVKPPADSQVWQSKWVTRFHGIIHLRGIISHKGYIVKLQTSD